jgi:hypothetical protein
MGSNMDSIINNKYYFQLAKMLVNQENAAQAHQAPHYNHNKYVERYSSTKRTRLATPPDLGNFTMVTPSGQFLLSDEYNRS